MQIKKILYTVVMVVTVAVLYEGYGNIKNSEAAAFTESALFEEDSSGAVLASEDNGSSNAALMSASGDYTYTTVSSTSATITGYTGTASALTIPSTIEGYTVTAIGDSAFENCTSLTSVTIPTSVTSIGASAFAGCTNLSAITFEGSITEWNSVTLGNNWSSLSIKCGTSCGDDNHTWDNGTVTKEATSTETGVKTYTCTVCEETKTETIAKIPATDTPSLKKTEAVSGGIKISWGSVSGASGYAIYRRTSSGSLSLIGNTTSTSYTDTSATAGTTYYYSVRAYVGSYSTAKANPNNTAYWSEYATEVGGKYIKAPTLGSVSAGAGGTNITWTKVSGASGYVVFRKTSGGSWTRVGSTTGASYTDTTSLSSGTTYYYTVRAYSGSLSTADSSQYNSLYWSYYNTTGLKAYYIKVPSLNKTEAVKNGIKISWGKVSGASGYMVYRKVAGGSWSALTSTTSTSYTDTTAATGKTYYYTVRAYKGSLSTAKSNTYNTSYWSGYNSTGVSGKYIKMPTISKAQTNASSTTLSWSGVSGASGYAVWRKVAGGSWSRIGYTTSTSYTDKSVLTSGKTYYYTIRAYSGSYSTANSNTFDSTYWSYYDTTGFKTVYLSTPTLTSKTEAANSGIKISWSKVSGASGYAVFRKKSGGSWQMLGTVTSTNYTDKTASANTTYYYTVRAYTGNVTTAKNNRYSALYWGGYDSTGVKGKYIKAPVMTTNKNANGSTTIKWGAVSGASGYAVWRKASGGSWSRIGYTTSTSYTDSTTLTYGSTYYYTVRAYSGSYSTANSNTFNSNYWSYYNTSGVKNVYLAAPSISTKTSAEAGGVKISWSSVKNASGYGVFRKTANGSWSLIGTTTSTSYVDGATLSKGTTYYYTVRALSGTAANAKSNKYSAAYWGGYDTTGVKLVFYLNVPTLKSASKTSSGINVSWNAVSGATGYAVYKKTLGGSWSLLGTTTGTSYTDKSSISSDTVYYYTVRAYRGSLSTANSNQYSTSYWSGYSNTGVAYSTSSMNLKAQQYTSSTGYLILVNLSTHKLAIYKGSQYNWTRIKYWSCSTGKDGKTPTGTFKTGSKLLSRGNSYTSWYNTYIIGANFFHSILYEPGSKTQVRDGRLGLSISDGCIRLALDNAKWLYDNVTGGTKVIVYK